LIYHRLAYRTHANDIPPLGERRYEPPLATEAGLEFIMGQIAKLPTRRGMHFAGCVVLRTLRACAGRPANVGSLHFGMRLALGGCRWAICRLGLINRRGFRRARFGPLGADDPNDRSAPSSVMARETGDDRKRDARTSLNRVIDNRVDRKLIYRSRRGGRTWKYKHFSQELAYYASQKKILFYKPHLIKSY
jgi:hypothetical protein